MNTYNADTFAPLVAAGFPSPTPGEAFIVTGDYTLGLLQGAAQALPAPWVLLAMTYEFTDEAPAAVPNWKGPRQWRCMIIDSVEAQAVTPVPTVTATIHGADLLREVVAKAADVGSAMAVESKRMSDFIGITAKAVGLDYEEVNAARDPVSFSASRAAMRLDPVLSSLHLARAAKAAGLTGAEVNVAPGRITFLNPNGTLPQAKPRTSLRKMGLLMLGAAAVFAALV